MRENKIFFDSDEVKRGVDMSIPGSLEMKNMPATEEERMLASLRMEKKDLERRLMEIHAEIAEINFIAKEKSKNN